MKRKRPLSEYKKRIRRRGWLLMGASLVLAFGMQMLGIILDIQVSEAVGEWIFGLMLFCGGVPLGYMPLSFWGNRMQLAQMRGMPIEQMQRYLLESREDAEQTAAEELPRLQRLRRLADGYAVLLGVFGACAALCSGIVYDSSWGTVAVFVSAFLLLSALSRIRFPAPKEVFSDNKTYVSEAEYPQLYAMARKAADALDCQGDIAISLQGDFNGGIAKIGNTYSVQLGAMLLELLSEKELYSVLIHEFAHMEEKNTAAVREQNYHSWLVSGGNPHFLSGLVSLSFLQTDTMYSYQMFLFDYAGSVLNEMNADRAMAELGDASYAASALLKMKYYDLYQWEQGVEDGTPFYAQPEAPKHVIEDQIKPFRAAMEQRAEDWDALVDCEIISRSASHPTLKMRLETLGVTDWGIAESEDTEAYRAECTKAREYVETLVYENGAEAYKMERIEEYLKPAARVAEWEEAGKPLSAAGYADVVDDLRAMGRNRDAEALCSRAIDELDTAAAAYAYFMRGLGRLHRYDPAGMDDLYVAMANNHNAIDQGLDAIGQFCCITGRQEELDTYRERAVQIGQHQKDVYSEVGVLRKKDRLVPEQLPEDLLAGLLDTVREADDGTVEAVYLVRKCITEDFFTSVVVVRFHGAPKEQRAEMLHKLFRYLDAADWQFSLFDYDEVKKVKVERIPDSCIYQRERTGKV